MIQPKHKFLILSCNTGQGHNSAGIAILNELKSRNLECEMKDTLEFSSEKTSKIISSAYMNMAKSLPNLFKMLYNAGDKVSNSKLKSIVYLANTFYADKLYDYINKNEFDTIITPHLFPAEALTFLKRKGINLRTFAVATDYTCIPFWEETEMDTYFLGHEDLVDEFVKKGIEKDKLIATGIPVDNKFNQRIPMNIAREQLNLSQQTKVVLIMCGSMGFGNVEEIIDSILCKFNEKIEIVVMCGKNKKLKQCIYNSYGKLQYVKPIMFTNNIDLYMDASDIVMTKPGGLTSTETAVKNKPMIHTTPIPGCETINAKFFSSRGMSISEKNVNIMIDKVINLLNDNDKKRYMIDAQNKNINKKAAKDICNIICK